tara:strand:+ start:29697 stop:29948 length:252 start_codon:yes stop_codon:yes gene_type:complete
LSAKTDVQKKDFYAFCQARNDRFCDSLDKIDFTIKKTSLMHAYFAKGSTVHPQRYCIKNNDLIGWPPSGRDAPYPVKTRRRLF